MTDRETMTGNDVRLGRDTTVDGASTSHRHARVAVSCVAFVAFMTGMSFAAVPLYDLFCRVTGFGGTTQQADAASTTVIDRDIAVRFDANVAQGLPWEFGAEQVEVELKVGENGLMFYTAENLFEHATMGTATFNVTPLKAGQYFVKTACFCFTEQTLESGERVEMPVAFYVDPRIADDPELDNVHTITLSYTFFPVRDGETLAQALAPEPNAN
ncbi:MAG: cytochrome c oxidase assembly protein [Pseudomonadota bacterium]